MNFYQEKTRTSDEKRSTRAASELRRLRRRRQNHDYLAATSRAPSLFTLRW
jgi:hypothetical protein